MIALDTNIISGLMNGTLDRLPDGDLYIPYVVQAEIYFGVAAGNNPNKYKQVADAIFNLENMNLSPGIDVDTRDVYVSIAAYLREKGTPISPNDLWIAAECISLGLPLHTLDRDFDRVPQLQKV